MVYGCYFHLRIVHQTDGPAWMSHYTYCPGNGLAIVIILHQLVSATQRIAHAGQTDCLPASSVCALPHACSMRVRSDHSRRRQSKKLGCRPQADQTQVAAAPQVHINSIQLSIHGLMVSMDARHAGEPGFNFLLRHFFENLTQHLALLGPPAGQTVCHTPLYDQKPMVKPFEKWWTIRCLGNTYSGSSMLDHPSGGQSASG